MTPAQGGILCGTAIGGDHVAAAENLVPLGEAGINCVEILMSARQFPYHNRCAVRGTAAAMAQAGVVCHSVHLDFGQDYDISSTDESVRRSTLDDMRGALSAAAALGAGIAVVHGSDELAPGDARGRRIEILKGSLGELAGTAADNGMRLALELLPRECLANTAREALLIVEGLPQETMGFCFDVNHVNLHEDPAQAVEALSGRISTFHVSDNDGVRERHWFPFEGVIDWPGFMGAVRRSGYSGQFIFETGGSLAGDVAQYLREIRVRFDRLMTL